MFVILSRDFCCQLMADFQWQYQSASLQGAVGALLAHCWLSAVWNLTVSTCSIKISQVWVISKRLVSTCRTTSVGVWTAEMPLPQCSSMHLAVSVNCCVSLHLSIWFCSCCMSVNESILAKVQRIYPLVVFHCLKFGWRKAKESKMEMVCQPPEMEDVCK